MMSHYERVPKTEKENLIWRETIKAGTKKGTVYQEQIKDICRAEPLFWLNSFGWVYEPRKQVDLPFITWPCQDEALLLANKCINEGRDLVAVKSRDMGYTWIILALFLHRWQFLPMQSFAVCSRVDELVEQTGSSDSLFWKLDMLIERQPSWLLPKGFDWRKHRLRKRLLNPELRCEIKGYATTNDVARGGRKLAILADELAAFDHTQGLQAVAAMQGASNTVIAVSTPQGSSGAFYDLWRRSQASGWHRRVAGHRLHWTAHPEKNKGLYTTRGNGIEILDKDYSFPEDYPFVVDREGKPRSPAYDAENERKSDVFMAQEWDMDFAGAGSPFFPADFLEKLERDFCKKPIRTGRLIFESDTLEPIRWQDDPKGEVSLWCHLVNGSPPPGAYGNGCDISQGTRATPSVQAIVDIQTGEKVAEYSDNSKDPMTFAREAIAMSKWFFDARLIWETNGVGATFTRMVIGSGYRCLYYKRMNEDRFVPKSTDVPGWHSSPQAKRVLFEEWREALGKAYTERSERTLNDAAGYIHSENGVEHLGERTTDDPSARGINHGDRAVASALAYRIIKDKKKLMSRSQEIQAKQVVKPGSVAWIIEQEEKARKEAELFGGLRL